jgi:hypothetical protein
MNCRNKWSYEFTKGSLGASFVNGELKEHQRKILIDSTIARREERMQGAINYRNDRIDRQTISELKKQIQNKKEELRALEEQIEDVENNIRIRNGERAHYRRYDRYIQHQNAANTTAAGGATAAATAGAPAPVRKFVMPCQKGDCNGMLNDQYFCELCNTTTCKNCLEPKQENHTCNPQTVETAKMIRKESKPCPKCGVRISKIDGCDQMWCVECKTAFSWRTGEIETRNIHNPHYFQFLRETGGIVQRNPQDIQQPQCRDIYIRHDALIKVTNNIKVYRANKQHENINKSNQVTEYIRYANHIKEVTVPSHEDRIRVKSNNLDNEYLYILGEISKETLGSRLMLSHKAVQKDQVFLDIYRAIGLMTDQICENIVNNNTINIDEIANTISKWSAYFNMELIKALLLHDSKREIIMFIKGAEGSRLGGWAQTTKKYENKNQMVEDIQKFKEIYFHQ